MGRLDNYIEVADRIQMFYKQYPEGSLRCKEWSIKEVNGQAYFVYVAQAFRNPDDPAPAEGIAWEVTPGTTNFTRTSEAMNAETSAWGRAIVALGISADKGIASANEVRGAQERQKAPDPEQVEEVRLRADLAKHGREKFNNDGAAFREWIKGEYGKNSANDLTVPEVRVAIGELAT